MFKNYLLTLGGMFKESAIFAKESFKKQGLVMWSLVLLQIILGIPLLYLLKEYGFLALSNLQKTGYIFGFAIYLTIFFIMFKKVFKLISSNLNKSEITYPKAIRAMLALGIFNCTPLLALVICYSLAQIFPALTIFLKIGLNIFTALFYFAMSLSLASIVLWQDKNVFLAILKSIKTFFKKFAYTIILFAVVFFLATLVSYVFCTILYAFGLYFNFLDDNLVTSIHAIINVYSLYVIFGLYIGAQSSILKGENE